MRLRSPPAFSLRVGARPSASSGSRLSLGEGAPGSCVCVKVRLHKVGSEGMACFCVSNRVSQKVAGSERLWAIKLMLLNWCV